MRIKKFMSVLLVMALMFSFCSFFVSAADGSENINTIDMNVSANVTIDTTPNVDGGVVTEDIEIEKSVVEGFSGFNGYIQYVFPSPTNIINERRLFAEICLVDNFSIVSGHEYNLKFDWSYNISLASFSIGLLRFYNNDGEIIKEQSLFVSNGSGTSKHHNVDISFIPDTKDLTTGYRCELVIVFQQNGYNNTSQAQRFYLSPEIVLIDKDDDSGWFQKILNKINDVWESIKSLPEKIGAFFTDLGENIGEFFTMLKNYILYFEHPVTLNDDGVLVDSSGNPIYTNPFASAMEKVKNTFNGWIDDIDQFVSDMDVSQKNVSSYLEKGTSIINDVMSASSVLTFCIIFAAGFLVIRKVVGR